MLYIIPSQVTIYLCICIHYILYLCIYRLSRTTLKWDNLENEVSYSTNLDYLIIIKILHNRH